MINLSFKQNGFMNKFREREINSEVKFAMIHYDTIFFNVST